MKPYKRHKLLIIKNSTMVKFLNLFASALIFSFFFSCSGGENNASSDAKKVNIAKGAISLSDAEMEEAKDIYFNTCAGCHGTTRKGATGPSLLPDGDGKWPATKDLGTEAIKVFINNGTPGGMPDWGKQGLLNEHQIDLVAKFVQLPVPAIPDYNLEDMKKAWKINIPVADRPTKPDHDRNWQNYFGVILRDAGQVAIIDGDTKETVSIVETGFAVHILRSSATGRYFYSIGRDGKVTLIDLWMEKPTVVAEAKASFDARSVDVSKYKGYEDKYIIVGGYTPAHFVIFDALTLEPLKIVRTGGYDVNNGEYLDEARVAAIVASHKDPLWVVNIKETGQVWLVDYSNIESLKITTIDAEQFLHDGGWDHTGRYFLVAANAKNRMVVIDVDEQKLESIIDVGTKPHPGRGANIKSKTYGHMWVTGHIGEGTLACIGTDPGPNRWKVVKSITLPGSGGGNLFVKSHPKSKHLWVDRALSNDIKLQRSVFVYDTETLELVKTFEAPDKYTGRVVHMEYNKAGDEVWVSVWGKKDETTSALLIYDDKTLELKHEITGDWLVTPTGKFNAYNTMHDIY